MDKFGFISDVIFKGDYIILDLNNILELGVSFKKFLNEIGIDEIIKDEGIEEDDELLYFKDWGDYFDEGDIKDLVRIDKDFIKLIKKIEKGG